MATDFGQKERVFLDGLKENTGRDLGEWLDAIAAQDLAHRNDIIDWLRQQGFMFSKASWLERIHHNNGRPIYADNPFGKRRDRRLPRERAAPRPSQETREAAQPTPASTPSLPDDDLSAVLAKAKAYRPLAQHVITQIRGVRPSARFLAEAASIAIADPDEFAVLAISGKELRLYLAVGEEDVGGVMKKAPPAPGLGKGERLTHMIVLTDARQIDRRLLDVVGRAAAKVNGR